MHRRGKIAALALAGVLVLGNAHMSLLNAVQQHNHHRAKSLRHIRAMGASGATVHGASGGEHMPSLSRLHSLRGGSAADSPMDVADGKDDRCDREVLAVSQQHAMVAECEGGVTGKDIAVDMTSKIQEGAGDGPTAQVETLQEGLARFHGTKGGKVFYNRVMVVNRDLSVLMLRWFVGQRAREQEEHHRKKEDDRLRKISSTINVSTPVNQSFEPSAPAAPAPTSERDAHTDPSAQHAAQHPDSNLASEQADERVTVLDAMSATGLRALRYALEVPEVGIITANDRDAEAAAAIRSNVALCEIPAGKIQVVESDAMSLMLARAGAGELFDVIDLDPFGSASALLSVCSKACVKPE